MTVHTICDTCGMEYDWPGVSVGNRVYCCAGCAAGGPCTCGRTATVVTDGGTVVAGSGTTVVSGNTVIAGGDDVVIIE